MSVSLDNQQLLDKYGVESFDYTDYPHKSLWDQSMEDNEYRNALQGFLSKEHDPIIAYIHIPFCKKLCYYCMCHKTITNNYSEILEHFDRYLLAEIDIFNKFIKNNNLIPNIKEIFLGGGSPTLLEEREFNRLIHELSQFLNISDLYRFCIEVDPRTVTKERLKFYRDSGVTTISLGIQDFDPAVQKAINRVQSYEMVQSLLDVAQELFSSINFDILVGLPLQTQDSVKRTFEQVVSLSPDRISLDYFRYATKFYPHMQKIQHLLPDILEKRRLYDVAVKSLESAGYVRTGFQHFAKSTDIVAKAIESKKAFFTSLGTVSGACPNVIAFGRSGHGLIGDSYVFQNYYEQELYGSAIEKGEFPIYRGHKLSRDDVIRRDVIRKLRTYFSINKREVEDNLTISFDSYFSHELNMLSEFQKDGLCFITENEITMTELGKHFAGIMVSVFDSYVKTPRYKDISIV
jgi:oxygen-independent coproporphyrinogen-3 oxidase